MTGRSRGFGFIEYTELESAEQAVKVMNGQELEGRPMKVDFPIPKGKNNRGISPQLKYANRLYIGNLSWNIKDEDLNELFCEYGAITFAEVVTEATGRSRGFGFVSFDKVED